MLRMELFILLYVVSYAEGQTHFSSEAVEIAIIFQCFIIEIPQEEEVSCKAPKITGLYPVGNSYKTVLTHSYVRTLQE